MLIIIPTYKRNHCLKWVLQSLVQCRTEKIPEPIRVVVVNNYPPAADEIKKIVNQFVKERKFIWEILFRDQTLQPVDNWYSAILEKALPNEVVFINTDDDLFYPWSLEDRFKEISRLNADLLLSLIDSCLFFSKNASRAYHISSFPKDDNVAATYLSMSQIFSYIPQHLSNHCYRNTEIFRESLAKAMSWCHDLEWLDFNNRTLYITLYLPYAMLLSGGSVLGLSKKCIIRARDEEEIRKAKYGVPSWNHAFIHLCALGVLNNKDLINYNELETVRIEFSEQFIKGFFTCFCDSRIRCEDVLATMKRINFPTPKLINPQILYGVELIIKDILRLRGLKLKRNCERFSVSTETFFSHLGRL